MKTKKTTEPRILRTATAWMDGPRKTPQVHYDYKEQLVISTAPYALRLSGNPQTVLLEQLERVSVSGTRRCRLVYFRFTFRTLKEDATTAKAKVLAAALEYIETDIWLLAEIRNQLKGELENEQA